MCVTELAVWCPAVLYVLSQVAAKLMLVSSFVAAHSIAQQVLGAHLTDSSSQQHATDSTQTDSQASADSNSELSPANNNSSSSQGQEMPDKKKVVAAAPAGAGSSGGDAAVAQRVLQESRAEADAALQYAHQVSS
jgi:mannitol-specific phosphotransferase system IIBC component